MKEERRSYGEEREGGQEWGRGVEEEESRRGNKECRKRKGEKVEREREVVKRNGQRRGKGDGK